MRNFVWVLLAKLFFAFEAWGQFHFPFAEPVQPPRAVELIAHRGMMMLAPENSAEAILAAAEDFVEWVEVDVRLSADGHHVLFHDESLDRTTDGKGPVSAMTLEALQKLDAGSLFAPRFANTRILSLREGLAKARGRVNLYLDCKEIHPEVLVRDILESQMEKSVVVFGDPKKIQKIASIGGGKIARMAKFFPRTMEFKTFLEENQPAVVEMDAADVTADICQSFHEKGVKVEAKVLGLQWDNPKVWKRMVECRVDWLQTEDPLGARFTEFRMRHAKLPVRFSMHRGVGRYAPENTLPAVQKSLDIGADLVEIDIRTTKDGAFVLVHDSTINRTTTSKGPVREMPLDAIRKLDAGTKFSKGFAGVKVPTLDEGLKALGQSSWVYLDAKEIVPEKLIEAVGNHNLWERHVVYQSADYCKKLKALDPRIRTLPPLKSRGQLKDLAGIKPFGVDASWSILTKELIEECHSMGIQVFSDALGFNETVSEYQKAIRMGVDVIQTDQPMRLLRAIELLEKSK